MPRARGVPIVTIDPDTIRATVAERLRLRRIQLNISQLELAKRIGVTGAQIQKYELGRDELRVPTLLALSAALDISALELIKGLQPRTLSTADRYAPPKKPRGRRPVAAAKSSASAAQPT